MAWKRRTKKSSPGKRSAPWRETRTVESAIGNGCLPGFGEACENPSVLAFPTAFMSSQDPCATIALWPVLGDSDFQSLDAGGLPRWKERVVHTYTEAQVTFFVSNLWLQDVYRKWLDEVNLGQAGSAEMWLPMRACLVIYDDDNVTTSAKSLYDPTFFENESYIPGSFKEYFVRMPGLFENRVGQPMHYNVKTRARRRLETGQTLYWQFEMGCALYSGDAAADAEDAFSLFGPPIEGIGTFRTAYIE